MSGLLGKALLQFQETSKEKDIITLNSFGDEEAVPVSYFFRSYLDMPELEQRALDLARGTVLDIGAGAGSHCLYLMDQGHDVLALDPSAEAIACCTHRGIPQVHCGRIQDFTGTTFDTLFMLMNGVGLAGSLAELDDLLIHLKTLLNPRGQILLDSSDIRYMYKLDNAGNPIYPEEGYYGEILFAIYYEGEYETPFPWLYVDYETLSDKAKSNGFKSEKIMDGPHFDYLTRLSVE